MRMLNVPLFFCCVLAGAHVGFSQDPSVPSKTTKSVEPLAAGAFAVSRALTNQSNISIPMPRPATIYVTSHLAHKIPIRQRLGHRIVAAQAYAVERFKITPIQPQVRVVGQRSTTVFNDIGRIAMTNESNQFRGHYQSPAFRPQRFSSDGLTGIGFQSPGLGPINIDMSYSDLSTGDLKAWGLQDPVGDLILGLASESSKTISCLTYLSGIVNAVDQSASLGSPDSLTEFGIAEAVVLSPLLGKTLVGPQLQLLKVLARTYTARSIDLFERSSVQLGDYFSGHNLGLFYSSGDLKYLHRAVLASAPEVTFARLNPLRKSGKGSVSWVKRVKGLGKPWAVSVNNTGGQFVTSKRFSHDLHHRFNSSTIHAHIDVSIEKLGTPHGWGEGNRQIIRIESHGQVHEVIRPVNVMFP